MEREDPDEEMILLLHPVHGLIWAVHGGSCARDFFRIQRGRLTPMLEKMQAYDAATWIKLQVRIGSAAWFDPATVNPHRFVCAVQDALQTLGLTPMRAACNAADVSSDTCFLWYEDLADVLRAFNMTPPEPVSDPVGPQLRLISSTPPPA
ncbi:hypothetical protein EPO33_05245 [Patescibacteria group bacterium]|nr:MAG: hypothetical protein EPO33_05245 [Patescibacteria group bacterium]